MHVFSLSYPHQNIVHTLLQRHHGFKLPSNAVVDRSCICVVSEWVNGLSKTFLNSNSTFSRWSSGIGFFEKHFMERVESVADRSVIECNDVITWRSVCDSWRRVVAILVRLADSSGSHYTVQRPRHSSQNAAATYGSNSTKATRTLQSVRSWTGRPSQDKQRTSSIKFLQKLAFHEKIAISFWADLYSW
jgi:hypothetical protein